MGSWLVTGQLIGLLASLPLSGRLCDEYGRRRIMLLGMCLFGVSLILEMFAFEMWFMIIARFFAGAGVGLSDGAGTLYP